MIRSPSGPENTATSDGHGDRESEKSDCKRAELTSEPALRRGPGEVGHDDHPKGLRRKHEQEVDAVGGKEAVGLRAATEFVGEQSTGPGRRQRDHDLREPGEGAAAQRTRCSENVSVRESHR